MQKECTAVSWCGVLICNTVLLLYINCLKLCIVLHSEPVYGSVWVAVQFPKFEARRSDFNVSEVFCS